MLPASLKPPGRNAKMNLSYQERVSAMLVILANHPQFPFDLNTIILEYVVHSPDEHLVLFTNVVFNDMCALCQKYINVKNLCRLRLDDRKDFDLGDKQLLTIFQEATELLEKRKHKLKMEDRSVFNALLTTWEMIFSK